MVTVHHLQNSRSQRILWLLEELGVPYTIQEYQRDRKSNLAPKALKDIHPLGKAPVITDGSQTIAESGAIVEYLIENYGRGGWQPKPGTDNWQRYRFAMHFAEGSLMPQLVIGLLLSTAKAKSPFFAKPIIKALEQGVQKQYLKPTLSAQVGYLENELAKSPWFAGDEPSGADVMMSFPLEAMKARGLLNDYPKLTEWVSRVHARPAYQAALKKSGKYDYA